MNNHFLDNFSSGHTVSSPGPIDPLSHSNNPTPTVETINSFIYKIGSDFKDILRYNQKANRYKFIGEVVTKPLGKSYWYTTIGLIYEDLVPENGKNNCKVKYKQDFILYDPKDETFLFVVKKEQWYKIFPKLEKFDNLIWNWRPDFTSYTNGSHYYNKEKSTFHHHFCNIEDFPNEIQKALFVK